MEPAVARRLWTLYEPYHAVTYFSERVGEAWTAAGVSGFWRGYFAGRAAPLAPCAPEVVQAAFHGFAPEPVGRAIPSVWARIDPGDALRVRVEGAVAALDDALGEVAPEEEAAAPLLRAAAEAATGEGRVLFSANAALDWPVGTRAEAWHAATLLREHRGDGHVAALVAADLDGCQANVLAVAGGPNTAARMQQVRGWTSDAWTEAAATLRDRGLLDADGALTEAGAALRTDVEAATDRAALRPWIALDSSVAGQVEALLGPVIARLSVTDLIPDPNPIGVPRPA